MNYPSIRIEGAILSPDILEGLHDDTIGQRPADFGLDSGTKVKDEIARAWADAQDYWRIFQRKLEAIKSDSPATTETRNLWMVPLLGLLGYQLEYQPKALELNGKTYAISHRVVNRAHTPLHIIGCRELAGLDKKPERTHIGTPRMSAHGLVQEYLNLHDELYGIVTNGRVLRLLRDSSRLIKLTYLEFDLDRIFTDGLFADFAVLYRLLHATRLPISHDTAAESLLELYHQDSLEQGTRIRDGLRKAVTEALEILGTGFLSHSKNEVLQQMVKEDHLRPDVYFNYLLRLVYRLLFVMVIEERGVVFPIETEPRFIGIYFQFYSVQRLRRLAITRGLKTERFQDAWASLLSTFQLFEKPEQAAKFGMTALGGKLFHPESLGPLSTSYLSNATLFSALDRLCYFDDPKTGQRTPVNFGALATEEFGSVYESLLELHPQIEILPTFSFGFLKAAGNERKTSGSYYTPTSLVDCLLESTLDPVIETRIKSYAELGFTSAAKGLLAIKVCDPACGSGHFLIAAAQRIARRLALLRSNGDEPAPDVMRHSLREVIGHCIFGVDINPMSVELCKLGLWLEAVEPGKPLTFLDHHIKCGNSLLGATPIAIKEGIPDDAFKPLIGDTKEAVNWMKKINKDAKSGQGDLFGFTSDDPLIRLGNLPAAIAQLEDLPDETPEALQAKENLYREIIEGSGYDHAVLLHDAWCAAFVWPKHKIEPGTELTTRQLREIEQNPNSISSWLKREIREQAKQYRFFHWHLEFQAVYGAEGNGGFDCILGNPPWERVKLQEKEFFAERSPEIASASNAATRKRLIAQLTSNNPALMAEFQVAQRQAEAESHLLRHSGLYPLCGRGDINLYAVFAEIGRLRLSPTGLMGLVLPSGIATDDTTKFYFQDVVASNSLVSLFDFENRRGLFPAVDNRMKFCLFTSGSGRVVEVGKNVKTAEFAFFAHSVDDLNDKERRFTLSAQDIALLNPNTRTCPIFRSRRDAELTKQFYRTSKYSEPWPFSLGTLFHSSNDADKFQDAETLERDGWLLDEFGCFRRGVEKAIPLYEGKMFSIYDHRAATVVFSEEALIRQRQSVQTSLTQHQDPTFSARPFFWVSDERIEPEFRWKWILCFKKVTSSTNERTLITSVLPACAANDSIHLLFPNKEGLGPAFACLLGNLSSYALDYVGRQKLGGVNFNFFVFQQLPILSAEIFEQPCPWSNNASTLCAWLLPRVLELTYTAWDLQPFAMECDFDCPPFQWAEDRRFLIRCELDAAFFLLYKIGRDDADYIMETFTSVKRKDEAQFGEYRTKNTILSIYDDLVDAQRTEQALVSRLDPPPADPRCCHPAQQQFN